MAHLRGLTGALAVLSLSASVGGCSGDSDPSRAPDLAAPTAGACRLLTPDDVARPTNDTATVDCTEPHTAETFAVGDLPIELAAAGYGDARLDGFAFSTCGLGFRDLLGVDESTAMRTTLSWAWFRPSRAAWEQGARWYRCDLVGGGERSTAYRPLPATASGLLAERADDAWMACVDGPTVETSPTVPCTEPHTWRAVATVKVGSPADAYPGDREVEAATRDYCSQQVAGWLGYPADYDYGYTWFRREEWQAGNRRSICWAATTA